jgi:hypothetical protein
MGLRSIPTREYEQQITKVVSVMLLMLHSDGHAPLVWKHRIITCSH